MAKILASQNAQEKDNKRRLEEIKKRVNFLFSGMDSKGFVSYVEALSTAPVEGLSIKPLRLHIDVLDKVINCKSFNVYNYYTTMNKAEELYEVVFAYEPEGEEREKLEKIFVEFFDENGIVANNLFNAAFYNSFKDKYNYLLAMQMLLRDKNIKDYFYAVTDHGIYTREFFIDDISYAYHIFRIAQMLINAGSESRDSILNAETDRVMKRCGIYNLDAEDIALAQRQYVETRNILKTAEDTVITADAKARELRSIYENSFKELENCRQEQMVLLRAMANDISENINLEYERFVQSQKNEVIYKRDEFLDEMFKEGKDKLEKLRIMAETLASNTNNLLSKTSRETDVIFKRFDELVKEDVQFRNTLEAAKNNSEFIEKVNKLELLNDSAIQMLGQMVEHREVKVVKEAQSEKVYVAPADERQEDEVIPAPNALLDERIPFEQRWNALMETKAKRVSAGEHFHKMFDDVLMAVVENANPYLIGPSGCGKTFMVKQIAQLLNCDYIDIGYINEEYEILGFNTATGSYNRPNFYRCYKYGKIAFCDELDNGNSKATVKLNSFLSNSSDASYNFPNGENVKRHSNFRIIGAGNTSGNGANSNYNTREKIEESVQQRFLPIYIDYDNGVEKKILEKYPDWFEFCILFREGTDAWGSDNNGEASGILTTRDAARIKKYLDNNSFSPEKIITYEFVQTKDMDYLLFLRDFMKNKLSAHKEAQKIYEMFEKQVTELRKKGAR